MQSGGRIADLWVMQNPPMYPATGRYGGPMSNVERQRRFRERNPGYHRRYYVSAVEFDAREAARTAASPPAPAPVPAVVDGTLPSGPAS